MVSGFESQTSYGGIFGFIIATVIKYTSVGGKIRNSTKES